MKIGIKRILHGEETVKALESSTFVSGKVPTDGFMITVNPMFQGSIFIRDSDLQKAIDMRKEKGKLVDVDAESWGENNARK
ncbi:hypothetical protein E2P64_07540 [Candidatus Bathyarchaeota archaeon]|nr:hypothetical protein E2P64_07540 [Candidatus Bathyarchaeota archaeon]